MRYVQWDEETHAGVDAALNEADMLGIRVESSGSWCDLLLHVLALPEVGPLDRDARRILRLTSPARVHVLLRRDQSASSGYGPVIPLASLAEVEEFFASLRWAGSMYGWKFLDDPSLTQDWPAQPSLTIALRSTPASHSLFWFNECGRQEGDAVVSYCIEGCIEYEDLRVLRADETPQTLAEFIADGDRHWGALHRGDERLSVEAQHAAQDRTPSWRTYVRNTVRVTGSLDPASE